MGLRPLKDKGVRSGTDNRHQDFRSIPPLRGGCLNALYKTYRYRASGARIKKADDRLLRKAKRKRGAVSLQSPMLIELIVLKFDEAAVKTTRFAGVKAHSRA